jgi:hypothetical protein
MSKGDRARKREKKLGGGATVEREARPVEPKEEESSRGGLLMGLRGGIKNVAGASGGAKKKPGVLSKALDWLLWIAVGAAVILFVLGRFRRAWH